MAPTIRNKLRYILLASLCFASPVISTLFTQKTNATQSSIIITEVMANPKDEDRDEFIELYNTSQNSIDLKGWKLTDGDALDDIVMWSTVKNGTLKNANIIVDATMLPASWYAVVFDPEYKDGSQSYDFPKNTLVLTIGNTTIGNGLSMDDPITIYNSSGTKIENVADTYGTPVMANDWQSRDDDKKDKIPFETDDAYSVEKIDYLKADEESNWQQSYQVRGTPGSKSSQKQVNHPPIARAGNDQEARVDEKVYFDAGDSFDEDKDELEYTWDFGDGDGAEEKCPSHAFVKEGTYEAKLTVADSEYESIDTLTVTVKSQSPTEQNPPTPPAEPAPTPINQPTTPEQPAEYSKQIIINEIFPDPKGSDEGEFIELKNIGSNDVDMKNWKVSDATEKKYTIQEKDFSSTIIKPNGFLVISRSMSDIALNNTGEEKVALYFPDDSVANEMKYTGAKEGESFSRTTEGEWLWTSKVTSGAENEFDENQAKNPENPAPENKNPENDNKNSAPETNKNTDNPDIPPSNDIHVEITEIYPKPKSGEEEWIEVHNLEKNKINMESWTLTDGKTKYTFPKNSLLGPDSFLVIKKSASKITLNNDQDSLSLICPNNTIKQKVSYKKSPIGQSYAKTDKAKWIWTSLITPGKKNMFSQPKTESQSKGNTEKDESPFVKIESIQDAHESQDGSQVSLSGIVSVAPNTLDKTSMYITDNERGIKIYFSKHDWPLLARGDSVEINGEISETKTEKKINVKNKEDIKKQAVKTEIIPINIAKLPPEEELIGNIVEFTGSLVKQNKTQWVLCDDQGEEIKVVFKAQGIEQQKFEAGSILSIIGLLKSSGSESKTYSLYPLASSDIALKEQPAKEEMTNTNIAAANMAQENKSTPSSITDQTKDNGNSQLPFVIGAISAASSIVGVVIGGRKWKWMRKIKEKILKFMSAWKQRKT